MIQISKLREAQVQTDQNDNNIKFIHQYPTRKRRLSVIGRYGFRAMSPILEKDEDMHYMNKKRHITEVKIKEGRTSAAKPKVTQKRYTSHAQEPLNLNKSTDLKFLNPADGKIDSRKRTSENKRPRKIKWQKKLRNRNSDQQKANSVSAKLPQTLSSEETLNSNKMNTISISFSRKKGKRDVDSSICMRRNNLEKGGSNSRKNKNSFVAKHNISSYPKKKQNCLVINDKKSYSSAMKQCRKSVKKPSYKSDSDNAVARRFQMQQLRKTLSSPPKFNKIKNTSTRISTPRTNKFKKKGHRRTSIDDEEHKKKETKVLYAKHLFPKPGTLSSTVPADTQNHFQTYKDTIMKKAEPDCSLKTPKHNQIMKTNAANTSALTFPQENCAQNVMSSEPCQKQTNCKKSVFSLGSTVHALSNLCNGEPPTKSKSKINLTHVSPKHSEKTLNENLYMKSYGIHEKREEHTNSFNKKLTKNQLIPGMKVCSGDNFLSDFIISNALFGNSISSEENLKMFPQKTSVANNDQSKQIVQYNVSNNLSNQRSIIKVLKPIHPDDTSKSIINTKSSGPLMLGAKCGSSTVPERKRKKMGKNHCTSTVKYYSHNFKKNNNFPNNTSNAAWILPKSFPHDWLNTQDDIQLERKKSMMSCNIEVVPNSNDYEWRTWF